MTFFVIKQEIQKIALCGRLCSTESSRKYHICSIIPLLTSHAFYSLPSGEVCTESSSLNAKKNFDSQSCSTQRPIWSVTSLEEVPGDFYRVRFSSHENATLDLPLSPACIEWGKGDWGEGEVKQCLRNLYPALNRSSHLAAHITVSFIQKLI